MTEDNIDNTIQKIQNADTFERALLPLIRFAKEYTKGELPTDEEIEKEFNKLERINYTTGFVCPESQTEREMAIGGAKWLKSYINKNN